MSDPKIGDKVQAWDSKDFTCLGWGEIIVIGMGQYGNLKEIPLIQLESGKKIWGDRCAWIPEKKAAEIGVRIFRDLEKIDPE